MLRHVFCLGRELPSRHQGALLAILWRERDSWMFSGIPAGAGLDAFDPYLDRHWILTFDGDILAGACGAVQDGPCVALGPAVTRATWRRRWVMRDAISWFCGPDGMSAARSSGLSGERRLLVPIHDGPSVGLACSAGFGRRGCVEGMADMRRG